MRGYISISIMSGRSDSVFGMRYGDFCRKESTFTFLFDMPCTRACLEFVFNIEDIQDNGHSY